MTTSNQARRPAPRRASAGTALLCWGSQHAGPYEIESLSSSGALLAGAAPAALGARARVILRLTGLEPLSLPAFIVHQDARHGRAAFAVAFQRVPDAAHQVLAQAVRTSLERPGAERRDGVLVADESAVVRGACEWELRSLSRRAVPAATPLDALRLLQDPAQRIGAALVGGLAGQRPGLDLLALIAADHPHVRRVLLTDAADEARAQAALAAGHVHAVLHKPWARERLVRALVA